MKWLLYALAGIGAIIGIGLIILLMLGGLRGESRHVASVDIAKPAATVFTWISDPVKMKSWMRRDVASQVMRSEPDRVVETRVEAPAEFTGDVIYELQPLDANRTRLSCRASIHYRRWMAKLFEPIISRSAQKQFEDDLQRLKQQAEAE